MSKIAIRLVALAVLVGACASEAVEPAVTSVAGTSADSTVANIAATAGTVPEIGPYRRWMGMVTRPGRTRGAVRIGVGGVRLV